MKSYIRKILFGDIQIREYVNIAIEDGISEEVYLKAGKSVYNISQTHWLLCIEPIVFGVWFEQNGEESFSAINQKCQMYFCDSPYENNDIKKNASAILTLHCFDYIKEDFGILFLFTAIRSEIHHLNSIKRNLLFTRYYKKNGLTLSKFKYLVSVYSYPREIKLISFREGDYYNIFPMDLLGEIKSKNRYVFGLRHTNVSLPKIIQTGKLVVSEVSFQYKDIIYELGKHHSSKPPSLDSLPFGLLRSKNLNFYIPDWVKSYREIKIFKTKNLGSHMLLWGELLEENKLTNLTGDLFLIHFFHYLHQKNKGVAYSAV
jgi:hypothetical protein